MPDVVPVGIGLQFHDAVAFPAQSLDLFDMERRAIHGSIAGGPGRIPGIVFALRHGESLIPMLLVGGRKMKDEG